MLTYTTTFVDAFVYCAPAIDEIVSNLLVLNVILSLLFRVAFART